MASELITSASKPRGFLATPSYLRLWFVGGIGNAMRWLELLVAGIFTYEVTQSTVLVALVIVARSLPMLLIGTIAGVVGEALNRKRLLVTQLFVLAVSSAVLCVLAFSGQIRVWHVAIGGPCRRYRLGNGVGRAATHDRRGCRVRSDRTSRRIRFADQQHCQSVRAARRRRR